MLYSTLRFAARNLLRQRMRTAVTLVAVVFGVVGLVLSGGFVQDVLVQLGEALIHSRYGHIQVSRPGFQEAGRRFPEQYLIEDSAEIRGRLVHIPGVDTLMERVSFSGLLNNGKADLPIVGEGVQADREAEFSSYLRVFEGRHLRAEDEYGALIGAGVARALALKAGDRVTLLANSIDGAVSTLDLQVVGIFNSFSKDFDARAVRVSLAAAHELLGMQGVNTIVVSLAQTAATREVLARVQGVLEPAQYEAKAWYELSDFYDKTAALYRRQFGVLRLIVLLMLLLGVANSVNMNVAERIGEFGTMRALGNRRSRVFRSIVAENVVLGVCGATVGVLLGVVLSLLISAIGIPMPPPPNADLGYVATIPIVPAQLAGAFLSGVIAVIAASILPAWRATGISVSEALRQWV